MSSGEGVAPTKLRGRAMPVMMQPPDVGAKFQPQDVRPSTAAAPRRYRTHSHTCGDAPGGANAPEEARGASPGRPAKISF